MNFLLAIVFGGVALVCCVRYAFELYVFCRHRQHYDRVIKQWPIRSGEDFAGEEVISPYGRLLFAFPGLIAAFGLFSVLFWIGW